jgi:hypothetical protein
MNFKGGDWKIGDFNLGGDEDYSDPIDGKVSSALFFSLTLYTSR